ncbi:MAG: hypothetical protein J6L76_05160 [Clostridia bacterium]|nr:hypothetical protein [Clostridia bacterium]
MGVVFLILFFILLLAAGLELIAAGIVGLVIRRKRRKNGKLFPGILTAVSAVLLSLGIVTVSIPVHFFSFIVVVNVTPPEDFVETDIVIEENGYQDTRFTADGVVYEVLDLYVCEEEPLSTPIFTYKYKGFFNASQNGNYYQIENEPGFHLVSDSFGCLFAPVEEREQILAYYADWANLDGYYDDWEERTFKISGDEKQVVQNFLNMDIDSLPQQKIAVKDAQEFSIEIICKEGIVFVESCPFVSFNNRVYYLQETRYLENAVEYTLTELPAETEAVLLHIHQSGD